MYISSLKYISCISLSQSKGKVETDSREDSISALRIAIWLPLRSVINHCLYYHRGIFPGS